MAFPNLIIMVKHLLILLFLLFSIKVKSQEITVVNPSQQFLADCLLIGSDGYVATVDTAKKQYLLKGIKFPINIHCYGFNSQVFYSIDNLPSKIELSFLSDSLNTVSVVQRRINPDESLRRIFNNTTEGKSPPDTMIQKFKYVLLTSKLDTLSSMTGTVSRDIGGKWHKQVEIYYDTITRLYLDSNSSEQLNLMWPTSFVGTRSNYFTAMLNESNASNRQEIVVNLDSIVREGDDFKYFFSGTNTHKRFLGSSHTSSFTFTGRGSSLSKAVLVSASFENPKDFMGNKSIVKSDFSFDNEIWYYGNEEITVDFLEDDKKCPGCREVLILYEARPGVPTNPKRFRTGYLNVWQFNNVARRDSLMQYLLAN